VRAEDDLTISHRREKLRPAGLPPALLSKLSKVLAYCARPAGERPRKSKKEKAMAPVLGIRMRPLQLPDLEIARDGAGVAPLDRPTPEPAATVPGSKGAKTGADAKVPLHKPQADVDDIFGDGVGSDYVCVPTEKQAKEAEVERRLAMQKGKGAEAGGAEAGAEAMSDGEEGDEAPQLFRDEAPQLSRDEAPQLFRDEASQLFRDALTGGAVDAGLKPGRERAGEAGKGAKGMARAADVAPAKPQGVSMGGVMDDSYAECFPDSFESYNMELGPDSDDETGLIRSTHDEPVEEATGKGGKKRPVDRNQVEAQKAEARMDRDLVQIEKLMEERALKKARGESLALGPSGRAGKGTPRGGDVDQNELF
jgi:IK cytokine